MTFSFPWRRSREYNYEQILKRIMHHQTFLDDVGDNLTHSLRDILQTLEAHHGSLFIFDKKEDLFVLKAHIGGKPLNASISRKYEFITYLQECPEVILKDGIKKDARLLDARQAALHYFTQLSCHAVVPLRAKGEWIGLLNIGRRQDGQAYDEMETSFMKLMGFWLGNFIAQSVLYQEVVKQNRQLAEMTELKSQLMANVTHELRTPLNGILGMTDILLSGDDGPLNDDQHRHLKMIHSAGDALLEIVNNILGLIKVEQESSVLSIKRIELARLVHEQAEIFTEIIKTKGNHFISDVKNDLIVYGDEEKLRIVILNLLSNATKFTHQGHIEVHAERSGEMIRLCVKDSGIGVRSEDRERIFNEFQQGDGSYTRTHGGAGLGLALAKKIIEKHHGRIWVESIEGRGSEFYCTLPLRPAEFS